MTLGKFARYLKALSDKVLKAEKPPINSEALKFSLLVGTTRLELTTSSTPRKRSPKLSYVPITRAVYHSIKNFASLFYNLSSPIFCKAALAASCSAAFLLRPTPRPKIFPSIIAAASKVRLWSGPLALSST